MAVMSSLGAFIKRLIHRVFHRELFSLRRVCVGLQHHQRNESDRLAR